MALTSRLCTAMSLLHNLRQSLHDVVRRKTGNFLRRQLFCRLLEIVPCSTGGARATAPTSSTFPSGSDSPSLSEPISSAQPEANSKQQSSAMKSLVSSFLPLQRPAL